MNLHIRVCCPATPPSLSPPSTTNRQAQEDGKALHNVCPCWVFQNGVPAFAAFKTPSPPALCRCLPASSPQVHEAQKTLRNWGLLQGGALPTSYLRWLNKSQGEE